MPYNSFFLESIPPVFDRFEGYSGFLCSEICTNTVDSIGKPRGEAEVFSSRLEGSE